ncbi:MAG: hypothetical protein WA581_09990, partial [Candidatus Acidiferrales bacterium]
MFDAKMHDEDDDELPGFDEEEEGPEQSPEIVEVEEVIIEEEPEEEVEAAPAPAPKRAPAKKAK